MPTAGGCCSQFERQLHKGGCDDDVGSHRVQSHNRIQGRDSVQLSETRARISTLNQTKNSWHQMNSRSKGPKVTATTGYSCITKSHIINIKYQRQYLVLWLSYMYQWRIQDFPGGGANPSFWGKTYYYRPQRSCGQGNIFTPVCHSFCSQGGREGVCLSACWDTTTPPGSDTTPPRSDTTPPDQADTPQTRQPPWTRQTPPGSRLQHTVYERPVRILLECILVWQDFCRKLHENKRFWTGVVRP